VAAFKPHGIKRRMKRLDATRTGAVSQDRKAWRGSVPRRGAAFLRRELPEEIGALSRQQLDDLIAQAESRAWAYETG
jgi:hypothetical protein